MRISIYYMIEWSCYCVKVSCDLSVSEYECPVFNSKGLGVHFIKHNTKFFYSHFR